MILLIAPLEALTDPLLTDPERRVLLSLFSFRGKDTNTVWPSITAIAERANIADQTRVSKLTASLASKGWLTKRKKGFTGCNEYKLEVPSRLDETPNLDSDAKLEAATNSNLDSQTNSNLDSDAKCKEQTNEQTNEQKKHIALEQQFKSIMASYPKREGSNSPTKAFASFKSRLAEGCKIEDMAAGVARYLLFCQLKGWIKTGYVMQASRFFGPGKEFENDWEVSNASSSRVTSGHSTGSVTEQSTVGKAAAAAERKRQEILARHGRGPGTGDGRPVGADGGAVRGEVAEAVR